MTGGASVLWYFQAWDDLRTYFSPRIAFGRSSRDSGLEGLDPDTSNDVGVSASFGAQYAPLRKFSVYGEVGYGFTRTTSEFRTPIYTSKTVRRSWSPRTSVGVIFYFGRS